MGPLDEEAGANPALVFPRGSDEQSQESFYQRIDNICDSIRTVANDDLKGWVPSFALRTLPINLTAL